jgi:hypothetical protein
MNMSWSFRTAEKHPRNNSSCFGETVRVRTLKGFQRGEMGGMRAVRFVIKKGGGFKSRGNYETYVTTFFILFTYIRLCDIRNMMQRQLH